MSAEDIDYSTLTDEEIEAMNADPSPEELLVMRQQAAADEDDDDDSDEDNDEDSDDDSNEEEAQAAPQEAEPAASDAVEQVADNRDTKADAGYRVNLPDDFDEQVQAAKQSLDDLTQRFKDGQIDFDEYQEQQATLIERREQLSRLQIKAEIAQEMEAQRVEQAFRETAAKVVADAKQDGVDYAANEALRTDFDAFLKALGANPANDKQPMEWFLREAHKRVMALHNITTAQPKQAKPPKPPKQAKVSDVPVSLANVVSGAGDSEDGGNFAKLDRLTGDAWEREFSRLSKAQQAAYMAQ